ncbi:MAG: helix-hairpin-helix domain-containing protein [Candidatus Omnitrophota bacterium]
MPLFSKPERYAIYSLILFGLIAISFSYVKNTHSSQPVIIYNIEEKDILIDINKAQELDFEKLPGIGPNLSKEIVKHRDSIGSFSSIEELKEVKGIGSKKLEAIRGLIKLDE